MAIKVRRVVTGHNKDGRAIVLIDDISPHTGSQRAGQQRSMIWTTTSLPANNDGSDDAGALNVGTGLPGGTVFGLIQLEPGIAPRNHRTSTIDYGVVLAGQLGLRLDEGEVLLNPGDVFVQRGTIHNWFNNGREPCLMAVVMVHARPVEAGGKTLEPGG